MLQQSHPILAFLSVSSFQPQPTKCQLSQPSIHIALDIALVLQQAPMDFRMLLLHLGNNLITKEVTLPGCSEPIIIA